MANEEVSQPQAQSGAPAGDSSAEAALRAVEQAVQGLGTAVDAGGTTAPAATPVDEGAKFNFPAFGIEPGSNEAKALDLLGDVSLNVKIELGRTRMLVEDVLKLSAGAVVELDKLAGDPVDVYVNDRYVARGEVLVLNDNFCVRINEIVKNLQDSEAKSQKAG